MAGDGADPLGLDAGQMRALGHSTVDFLAARLEDPGAWPALREATPDEMAARLGGPPPERGEPFEALLERLAADVLPFTSRVDHPRYFAFIPSCGNYVGALGDFIASALNVYAGCWMEGAGPAQVELDVLDWFKGWIGYPPEAAGVLTSGGSAANMTALACARETLVGPMRDDVVGYVADQSHSSVARAARVLGFRPTQIRVLPCDRAHRLRVDALSNAMAADAAAGRMPLFVSAAAGSTNTGAVDPLNEIADVCARHGAWLHVDGAYGGFAALTERGRRALAGIERADSVTLDPHKWLHQPLECGALLVRDGKLLEQAFTITPDYLRDTASDGDEVNFSDRGVQLTRMWRALKVWLSLRHHGVAAFRATIDAALDLALEAQALIEAEPELELLSPAQFGIVCFRRRIADEAALDAVNAQLVRTWAASGRGLVSSTRLRGGYAIRLCVLNHTSTSADVRETLEWFASAQVEAPARESSSAIAIPGGRQPVVGDAVAEGEPIGAGLLGRLPLLAGLPADVLERAAAEAREVRREPGESVVRHWEPDRDIYFVLAGSARVHDGDRELRVLGPGEFFGELAALNWGADYAYPRLASVTAATPLRLVRLPPPALHRLMRESPAVGAEIHRVAAERLERI